ncbi:UNVERIFIED_CONTAM: hypothetical protein GTU68_030987 [Idotea baltica]|nr:hypothetical protein [Idotea baltica]
MGGKNPIRIQSMTTTDTMDTMATVEQTLRMVASGAEYVRITAPSLKEAKNLEVIKQELRARGCNVPLVADIHFTPNAAELAARIVEKVRVNPDELDRIHKRFAPLVKICKEHGTAMRIGTNHGSLSDRIMSRYGDTPLGMVESAMEFIRICEHYDFDQIVVSMKASNPQVMVQAYRMLVQQMLANGKCYPLHLGVTEAGEGEDGRIKSAQGIAALLMDGIGDTVRVSLTEEPEFESPVGFGILQASRLRMTKTEYISCPSCGRTLFDLQETTAKIRSRTEHLKGLKIGIMGCIVNGPGEMADADYGYVGVGPDKIALYRGKEVVERGVKTAEAVDRLIDLIASDGNWIDREN